jgi:hypothetical protein
MGPITTSARSWRVLGVAALAVAALGGGVLAQSSAPQPSGGAAPTPASSGAPSSSNLCAPRGWRDMGVGPGPVGPGMWGMDGSRRMRRADGRAGQGWPPSGSRGQVARIASVSAIAGTSVTLVTADGWSRTVDTADVPITTGAATGTLSDLAIGTHVGVVEQRGADGTWQVTGLRIVLTTASGTVSDIGDATFQVSTGRGSTVVVRVSGDTAWVTGCQSSGSLADLQVGSWVLVRGVAAADGSIDATSVADLGMRMRGPMGAMPGMPGQRGALPGWRGMQGWQRAPRQRAMPGRRVPAPVSTPAPAASSAPSA